MGSLLSSKLIYETLGYTPVRIQLEHRDWITLVTGIRADIATAITMQWFTESMKSSSLRNNAWVDTSRIIDDMKETKTFSDFVSLYTFLRVQCTIYQENINTHLTRIFQTDSINSWIFPIIQQLLDDPLFLTSVDQSTFQMQNPHDTLDACLA